MIDIDKTEGIPVVTMRSGENRFNLGFVTALGEAIEGLRPNGGPFVLTGTGKFFCNGLDLDWLGTASSVEVDAMFGRLYDVLGQLLAFPGVVVAALNGHAFGAGAILASAADFRVQRADRGYFCFPEVDLGLAMSPEFDAVLRLKFPSQQVLHALLSGERFGGDHAHQAGFVDAAVPESEVLPRALDIARRHADKQPSSVGGVKAVQHAPALSVLPSR